jgi:phospholipid-binding lipoprotein MlaA
MIAYAALIALAQPVTSPADPALSPTTNDPAAAAPAPAGQSPENAPGVTPSGPVMQDIVVIAPPRPTREDPLARTNVQVFKFTRAIDGAITEPASLAFKRAVPSPLRDGVRNVFNNLEEPMIAANFLLQLHPGKAIETLVRMTLNTAIGWGGLFDVAGKRYINLPRRSNGFADTLGYYGVKPGFYLFLPLVGPTNPRDLVGGAVDMASSPLPWVGGPFKKLYYQAPASLWTALDTRAEFQRHLEAFRDSNRGVYVSERDWYRRLREARIAAHKAGDHGPPVDDVPFVVPEAASGSLADPDQRKTQGSR